MEEEIKAPDYPKVDGETYPLESVKSFLSQEREVIKNILNDQPRVDYNKYGFNISSEDICLMVSADSFKDQYEYIRNHLIHTASFMLKSNNKLTIEDVEMPIVEDPSALKFSITIVFKEK